MALMLDLRHGVRCAGPALDGRRHDKGRRVQHNAVHSEVVGKGIDVRAKGCTMARNIIITVRVPALLLERGGRCAVSDAVVMM